MVDRGTRRISSAEAAAGKIAYEAHGNGWRFAAGHRIRIEIAQDDHPFVQFSSVPSSTTLNGVSLHIPVREGGSIGGGPENPSVAISAPGACATQTTGTKGNDELSGTDAGDEIKGGRGNDKLDGLGGDDCLRGNAGGDRLRGGAGADQLAGGPGADALSGGDGDDELKARAGGRDLVRCGPGKDTAVVDARDRVRGCEKVRLKGEGGGKTD